MLSLEEPAPTTIHSCKKKALRVVSVDVNPTNIAVHLNPIVRNQNSLIKLIPFILRIMDSPVFGVVKLIY
jgi:hypothetical protein